MCVRDEEPVIQRSLNSLINIILEGQGDIFVCDTGSADATIQKISEWGQEHPDIPVTILEKPWKNFGSNKTWALRQALNTEPKPEYVCFFDADEVFVTDPKDSLSYLTREDAKRLLAEMDALAHIDVFYMMTHWRNLEYRRWQIVRNNQVWTWEMPFQECLVGQKSNNLHMLTWVHNYSRPDGNSSRNPGRHEWSIGVMQKYIDKLVRKPNHPQAHNLSRAIFYLAQTLFPSQRSYDLFVQRVEMLDGNYHERYIGYLKLGEMETDVQKKREFFLRAIQVDPQRLEAYYRLMRLEGGMERHRPAVGWALMAPGKRIPSSDFMFIEKSVYEWEMDFWIGVYAWHGARAGGVDDSGIFRFGYDACLRALDKVSEGSKEQLNKNIGFYLKDMNRFFPTSVGASSAASSSASSGSSTTPFVRGPQSGMFASSDRTLIVVDNFFVNPDAIRAKGLTLAREVFGNFPGSRSVSQIDSFPGIKEHFEYIIGRKISYWPVGEKSYNGSYQLTLGDHKSWIHRDLTDWSCVIFLTPNAPPDGGTKIYLHKETGLTRTYGNKDLEDLLNKDSGNESAWHILDRIGNLFNRAVFFRGKMSHMSDRYFGTTPEDGRLFLTFFFDDKI